MALTSPALSSLNIGMSVPGANGGTGSSLINQVTDETDEQRRKRLLAQQQARLLPGTSTALASIGIGAPAGYFT